MDVNVDYVIEFDVADDVIVERMAVVELIWPPFELIILFAILKLEGGMILQAKT